jgi:hypothetical protein
MTVFSAGAEALVRQLPATANCVIMQSQNFFCFFSLSQTNGACFHFSSSNLVCRGHILSTAGDALTMMLGLKKAPSFFMTFDTYNGRAIVQWRRLLYLSLLTSCPFVYSCFLTWFVSHFASFESTFSFFNFWLELQLAFKLLSNYQNFMCKNKTKTH